MGSTDEAEKVVQNLNGQEVDGRVLRVNVANVDA
jgi:RNA recognition motif-containing protein